MEPSKVWGRRRGTLYGNTETGLGYSERTIIRENEAKSSVVSVFLTVFCGDYSCMNC